MKNKFQVKFKEDNFSNVWHIRQASSVLSRLRVKQAEILFCLIIYEDKTKFEFYKANVSLMDNI